MRPHTKRCLLYLILFVILTVIDRITKNWAVIRLLDNEAIPVIPGILELFYLPNGNTGAAFGILSGHRILFLVIAFIVVAAIIYLLWNMPEDRKYRPVSILLVFIAAGGVGNMIDRFFNGYVVDFIYISAINFPIFNVADMYVSVCTIVLALIVLFKLKEDDYNTLETAFSEPLSRLFSKKK